MSFSQKVKSALWGIVDIMELNLSPFIKQPEKDFSRERKLSFHSLSAFVSACKADPSVTN